jgi:hypothetical protein
MPSFLNIDAIYRSSFICLSLLPIDPDLIGLGYGFSSLFSIFKSNFINSRSILRLKSLESANLIIWSIHLSAIYPPNDNCNRGLLNSKFPCFCISNPVANVVTQTITQLDIPRKKCSINRLACFYAYNICQMSNDSYWLLLKNE